MEHQGKGPSSALPPPSTPTPASSEFLQFDTDFECGNLERVEKVLQSHSHNPGDRETHTAHIEEYYLTLTNDPQSVNTNGNSNNTNTNGNNCNSSSSNPGNTNTNPNSKTIQLQHNQWFHFRVRNMKPSIIYKFKIVNMTQPK